MNRGPTYRKLMRGTLPILVLALGLFFARDGSEIVAAGNYAPSSDVTLSSNSASAVADTTYAMNIGTGELNFGGLTLQSPPAACVAPGPESEATTCAAGARPDLGDVVGTLASDTNLGLTNTPCSSLLIVTLVFLNATVDNSAGNLIYPSSQAQAGSGGIMSPLLHDVNTVGPGTGQSESGVTSPPNGLPGHVDRYPAYLNTIFDPDGPGPVAPLQPLARYSGGQIVVGTAVVLTIPVFAPGAFSAFATHNATNPLADMAGNNLGYVAVPVLQDPTRPESAGAITDFCTPVDLTSVLFGETRQNPCNGNTSGLPPCNNDANINNPSPGVPTGRVRWQNPSTTGTHYFGTYQYSQRDLDGDGIENSLDTCPYASNTDGDPRVASGADADMLDSACDPGPAANNNNQDNDGAPNGGAWTNAGDNCPLSPNSTQIESERSEPDNVSRPRGGTSTDSLGDACDGPETACGAAVDDDVDGLLNDGCATVGGPDPEAVCTFATSTNNDEDLDGLVNDGCPAQGGLEFGSMCNNAIDDDGDGAVNDGCPAVERGEDPADCANSFDDDLDGSVNDGCPATAVAESGPQCLNASDDDLDFVVNDGCPEQGAANAEMGPECANGTDDDGDTFINDGCPGVGPPTPESGADCLDHRNDDSFDDPYVNDGCPAGGGPELGCLNTSDDDADGSFNDGCPSSARVANGHYHTDFDLITVCIGGTDTDGDGYCLFGGPGNPNDTFDGDANRIPETYSQFRPSPVGHSGSGNNPPASREPVQICGDGVDNDGDTLIDLLDGLATGTTSTDDCRPPDTVFSGGKDTDGDGAKDEVEIYAGTDPLSRCDRGFSFGPSKGWAWDLRGESAFSADKVNVSDLGTYTNPIRRHNTAPGDANFDRRWDIRPGTTVGAKWINVADLAAMATNTPVPMYEIRAFGYAGVCSAHPVYND